MSKYIVADKDGDSSYGRTWDDFEEAYAYAAGKNAWRTTDGKPDFYAPYTVYQKIERGGSPTEDKPDVIDEIRSGVVNAVDVLADLFKGMRR